MISFNYENCINCLNCAKVCPLKAIDIKDGRAEFVRNTSCISCGHCISVCPTGAVSAEFTDSLPGKSSCQLDLPLFQQVEDLLLSRRSVRSYSDKEVEKEKLDKVLRIAAHAPSGTNRQNAKYFVVGPKGTTHLEQLAYKHFTSDADSKIGEAMINSNYHVLLGAPITIGLYSNKGWGIWSCALAAQNLVLAAHALGLGTCYNGIFHSAYNSNKEIKDYFDLCDDEEMFMFISLGYPNPEIEYGHVIERKIPNVIWRE
jgi:nitroreductase/NAD-dependent dihydropyrimidine dehydrogenase PreA subunit